MRKDALELLNHVTTIHTEKTRNIISMVPDGGNYKNLPEELRATRKVNIAWTRMNSEKPCFTIDTGHVFFYLHQSSDTYKVHHFFDRFLRLSTLSLYDLFFFAFFSPFLYKEKDSANLL